MEINIYRRYKRFKKAYRNVLSVMWNLYIKKSVIDVILRDGIREKLSPGAASGWALITEKCYSFKGTTLVQTNRCQAINKELLNEFKKLSDVEWKDLWHLLANGTEFQKATDIMKSVEDFRKNEMIQYKTGKVIIMHGLRDNGDIIDVFINEDYKFLEVKDRVVIDLGANIGDSAIYFALNGAKKIIALEPFYYTFSLASQNIKENHLEDKIELLNAGYGVDGEILVDEDFRNNTGTKLRRSKAGKKIRVYSLKSLAENYLLDKAILKMDCEGCEYNLLNEDNSVISKFSKIQIEYHRGYKRLVKKLKNSGFNVEYIKRDESKVFGYIYASRC